jgi:hypothetical protein
MKMFKWFLLGFFIYVLFLAPRDYVYEQVNTKGQIVEEQENEISGQKSTKNQSFFLIV